MPEIVSEAKIEASPIETQERTSSSISGIEKETHSTSDGHAPFCLTPEERKREWIQLAALFYALFNVGWVDGSTGPLLPTFERYWGVSYAVVSLIFIFNCLGVLTGVACLIVLGSRIGFGKLIAVGSICSIIAAAIQASRPPFPVLILAYYISGIGLAFQDAAGNGYVACLREQAAFKMGLLHAFYGLGALVAPLVSTQFAPLRHFSFHFFASLGIAAVEFVVVVAVFKFKKQTDLIAQFHHGETSDEIQEHVEEKSHHREVLKNRNVHLLAYFCFIYVGVEVSTGGWIVTFIMNERGGGHSSGYVSAGFFGGLTLGRLILLPLNSKLGEYRVIFLYSALSVALEIVIWLTHSIVGNALAASFIGMLLGPMYPIMVNQGGRILPRRILTPAIGFITAFGTSGSAIFPFVTGALAGRFGIIAMIPLSIILICVMVGCWALVPEKLDKDSDGSNQMNPKEAANS